MNFLDNTTNHDPNLEQKIRFKETMRHVKRITPVVKLNLKLQC